jgi:hypothetical protein
MKQIGVVLALAGSVVLSACSDPTNLELKGGVAVSFATRSPAPSAPALTPAVALDDTIIGGTDTLIVTRAQVVLREIELKRLETADCDVEPEPAGCEEVEVGPVLVDLPLVPGAEQQFSVEIPTGTYTRIDFEVHKVGNDPEDLAFLAQHPEFAEKSIRVEGTFNSQAFLFESDLDVEQEIDLQPPMLLAENTNTNVTIFVEIDTWFRDQDGTLVDPATANKGGPNESDVKNNIQNSLKAFEDPDGDGLD